MAVKSIPASLIGQLMAMLVASMMMLSKMAKASDPEATSDFVLPQGTGACPINSSFFAFTGFRKGVGAPAGEFKALKASVDVFPALDGLGISAALLEFQPLSQNTPHTHPRATELLFVVDGTLTVGLVDTTNKLYSATLQTGDLFVFPKGLVHFQVNPDRHRKAHALSSFSSQNAGVVSLAATLFGSKIPVHVLKQAFQVDDLTVSKLQAPFEQVHIN